MSLYITYTETLQNDYILDLPDDIDLIEVNLIDEDDLPKGWDKETFLIRDLLNQNKDFISKIVSSMETKISHNSEIEDYINHNQSGFSEPEIDLYDYDYEIDEDGGQE
tara:strand:- start:2963 stop:3286 length:324 start_codon:yes stop_codon:yes gene_type:complete